MKLNLRLPKAKPLEHKLSSSYLALDLLPANSKVVEASFSVALGHVGLGDSVDDQREHVVLDDLSGKQNILDSWLSSRPVVLPEENLGGFQESGAS